MFRFAVFFLGFIVLFRVFATLEPMSGFLQGDLCRWIAQASAGLLSAFSEAQVRGAQLGFHGFWVVVAEPCNGVLPTTIYMSAVLAFPSSWRATFWGLGLGVPAIALLNVLRVTSLVVLGAYRPDLFEQVHLYVWQTLVVALSMVFWIVWVEFCTAPVDAR